MIVSLPARLDVHVCVRSYAHLLLELLILCLLLLLVLFNLFLCLASCVLHSLCAVFGD